MLAHTVVIHFYTSSVTLMLHASMWPTMYRMGPATELQINPYTHALNVQSGMQMSELWMEVSKLFYNPYINHIILKMCQRSHYYFHFSFRTWGPFRPLQGLGSRCRLFSVWYLPVLFISTGNYNNFTFIDEDPKSYFTHSQWHYPF